MQAQAQGAVVAIIPARAGSARLPLKPLADLAGRPLIARVYQRVAALTDLFDAVYVTTDDPRIEAASRAAGAPVLRVDAPCASGTERVARAAAALPAPPAVVVNVQGDEPFVAAEPLRALVAAVRGGAAIATAAAPCPPAARADRHAVKVVCDGQGRALYFSRAPIPGDLHLGLYAFSAAALAAVAALPRGPLAVAEDLEQLAWLEAGWPIQVCPAAAPTLSIDTPADLALAHRLLAEEAHR